MRRKTLLGLLAVAITMPASAARQATPPVIDGNISDIDATGQLNQTVASSFGAGNIDLFNARVSHDDSNLYIGLSSKLDPVNGTRGVWIILDTKPGGQNTLAATSGPGGALGLNGTVLENGFTADYILFLQNGNDGSRPTYYLNVLDLQAGTDPYYGEFNLSASSFSSSGAEPGFAAAVDNSESATLPGGAAGATKGFEFQIPLSALGTTASSANSIQILVGAGDGGNGYWSNQTLPTSNSTGNLGGGSGNDPKPNFDANTYGQWGDSGTGFSGSQVHLMTLPVSLSGFSAE